MLRYAVRLLEKHPRHTHFSCAILLDRNKSSDTLTYIAPTKGSSLTFGFPVVNLGSWANRQDELRALAPTNPFAVVVLAQLACRATQPDIERLVSKLELAKLLKQWGYNETLRANLLRTIDSMLILPEALEDTFYSALTQIEDTNVMQFISSIERIYWDRKIAEIKDDLLQKDQRQSAHVLQTQLQQKFGVLPDWVIKRIHHADTQTLQNWAINVLPSNTLEDVFEQ